MVQPSVPACAGADRGTIVFRQEGEAKGAVLRLADVADLSALPQPIRDRAAKVALPWPGTASGALRIATLASVARARIPALACRLPSDPQGDIAIRARPVAPSPARARAVPVPVTAGSVQPGDTLALTIGIGVVRVERQVEVLQRAASGGRLFVRDGDGQLLSVRYAGAQP